ncbi:MAG TPA: 50S ribosomal protein L25 [Terriglobia bacterium]|nr:50S ribosomal protein L25 [Terriglobia bacterium]
MSQAFTVEAEPREDFGKNAARRTRRSGRIPGVVYGGGGPVIPVTVDPEGIHEVLHSESGQNAIFTLQVRGKAPARAMIRDWQAEPVHGGLLHVDLVRIALDTKLKLKVAIHVTGEPQGVKVQGGIFEFMLREVEVECLPDDIPDAITVDVSPLTLGQNLRVADLPMGPKVKVLTDPSRVVAHVVTLKVEEEKPAEVAEAAPAEPEVIRKGKVEEEGAEEEAAGDKKEKGKEKTEK